MKIIGAYNGKDKETTIVTSKGYYWKNKSNSLAEGVKRYIDTRGV